MKTITLGMLGKAFVEAMGQTTMGGLRKGGWVRLARVGSRTDKSLAPYTVAIRATNSNKNAFQLACSCKDWIHRRQHLPGIELCKHQKEVLTHEGGSSLPKRIWMYKAGQAAFANLRKNLNG